MAETVYEHPQGDLEPDWVLQLLQGDGTPVQGLSTALRVELFIWEITSGKLALQRDLTIVDASTATVSLTWQLADPVQTVGLYLVKAKIHWPSDRPQTVPSKDADRFVLRVR